MKTFQIENENNNMARRLREVKSVVNKQSKMQTTCNKRKAFEKKCLISNDDLRKKSKRL